MRLVLVTDAFPPMRSSGAVQVRDFARKLGEIGHEVSVVAPSPDLEVDLKVEELFGVKVIRVKVLPIRNIGYVHRTISEMMMPLFVIWRLYEASFASGRLGRCCVLCSFFVSWSHYHDFEDGESLSQLLDY